MQLSRFAVGARDFLRALRDIHISMKSSNTAAVLSYQGHVLMESRSGSVVGAVVTHADGYGERAAALAMLDTVPGTHPKTLAATRLTTRVTSSPLAAIGA